MLKRKQQSFSRMHAALYQRVAWRVEHRLDFSPSAGFQLGIFCAVLNMHICSWWPWWSLAPLSEECFVYHSPWTYSEICLERMPFLDCMASAAPMLWVRV